MATLVHWHLVLTAVLAVVLTAVVAAQSVVRSASRLAVRHRRTVRARVVAAATST